MKNYYIKTYGCKLNQADSELIKKELGGKYKLSSEKEADLVVLNTCGVVDKTERKILKKAKVLKKQGKKVVLAGCLPLIIPQECKKIADEIIPISETRKHTFCKQGASSIVPISRGCLGNCTYCVSRLARGKLISFDPKNIISNIEKALALEAKEIQLTSQDLAIYGLDKGKQELINLLKEIDKIEGSFKIKLGMMNPKACLKILKPLLKIYESDKFYKFLHIPLQSGDNELLKKMNRGYKVSDFVEIVKAFRKKFKGGVIATDIIVGHPLETEKAFQNTIKIIKRTKPDIIHIFRFSKRPGTNDFSLKELNEKIKKQRSRDLTKIFVEINEKRNKRFVNKKMDVLIVEKRKNSFLARNNSGRAIVLKQGRIGEFRKVKISDSRWNYLIAQ